MADFPLPHSIFSSCSVFIILILVITEDLASIRVCDRLHHGLDHGPNKRTFAQYRTCYGRRLSLRGRLTWAITIITLPDNGDEATSLPADQGDANLEGASNRNADEPWWTSSQENSEPTRIKFL